jgi:serine/threonine protein kinase
LKLCNFYLDSDKNVKLGDFGFACQLSHPGELKRETCGTPNYIAPEAVSGFGYSFSSDVWAIGVILYRLKFKLCPFEAKTVRLTLEKVKTCQYYFPKG